MQIKVVAFSLLSLAITAYASAHAEVDDFDAIPWQVPVAAASCNWAGTAPICSGSCSSGTYKLTSGAGGCGNGNVCATGGKAFCCSTNFRPHNCEWYGTAPICAGSCPAGKYRLTSDGRGDGNKCVSGCKVYCCSS